MRRMKDPKRVKKVNWAQWPKFIKIVGRNLTSGLSHMANAGSSERWRQN